ncbi:beta-ketoacyl synthase N-terminal-like domain-containing protein [Microbulbifer spongiae]|uniref:Ketosynthase family 3 (KS3) domain-containing protein n=1 Tax=Microbulbifer spongiae TaxID=2944933 RepID=A0ABY9EAQ7_9GAMM|nr:beta-ketoacyl synthase N-terminal-like domain-containing protein [Microbulbifer sp. MI-G]WKD49173.1 hypothetical protein M8T91_14915 [Microbulbifer sp. MI-G]
MTIAVTGIGITTSIGQGREEFTQSLFAGMHKFSVLKREGRQLPDDLEHDFAPFIGAEISELRYPDDLSSKQLRTLSWSGRVAAVTAREAWQNANLDSVDGHRVGLILSGSNFQQREQAVMHRQLHGNETFTRPAYGISFMDTDVAGFCCEYLGVHGFSCSTGGASASGQFALINAINFLESGSLDACIVLGMLTDLSHWELQALRSAGALGSERFAKQPEYSARPFDKDRDGFIFGECCGALVIEKAAHASARQAKSLALITGWGTFIDGNRNPNPSLEGEKSAIRLALRQAGITASDIDYVNPHGTGSLLGDAIELEALAQSYLLHARINTTKSLLGHGLAAAGLVEVIVTIEQMIAGRLHPSRNLQKPLNDRFFWVKSQPEICKIKCALNLSLGFGGMNSAICITQ